MFLTSMLFGDRWGETGLMIDYDGKVTGSRAETSATQAQVPAMMKRRMGTWPSATA